MVAEGMIVNLVKVRHALESIFLSVCLHINAKDENEKIRELAAWLYYSGVRTVPRMVISCAR